MAVMAWVKEMLKRENVPFRATHHRTAMTSQALAEREHVSGRKVAKTVVVLADGRPLQLVLPATRWVDLGKVRRIAGASSLRLASEDEMAKIFADSEVGAAPPLRHWPGVEVWVDPSLPTDGDILLQGGTHEDCVSVNGGDWFRLARPRRETFCE